MARFGMHFTDPDGKGSLAHRKAAQERNFFVVHEEKPKKDTTFLSILAFASFLAITFAVLCVFAPDLVLLAANVASNVLR